MATSKRTSSPKYTLQGFLLILGIGALFFYFPLGIGLIVLGIGLVFYQNYEEKKELESLPQKVKEGEFSFPLENAESEVSKCRHGEEVKL